MASNWIIKPLDELDYITASFVAGTVLTPMDAFDLQRMKEAFHGRVIVRVTATAHTLNDAVPLQAHTKELTRVLNTAIRMVDKPGLGFSAPVSHGKRIAHKFRIQLLGHRPTYNAPSAQIEHSGQVKPAFRGRNISRIRKPYAVGLTHLELLAEQVRGHRQRVR